MEPIPEPLAVPRPPSSLAPADLAKAVVGGLAGALLGGLIWGFIVGTTNTELGIAAIGVGALAGFGVVVPNRNRRGVPMQVVAAACAIVGVLFGKYFAFVQIVNDELGPETASLLSGRTFRAFTQFFGELVGGFDVLWLVFAVYTAWRIPQGRGFGRWAPGRAPPPPPAV
jgi:hypothetical protein